MDWVAGVDGSVGVAGAPLRVSGLLGAGSCAWPMVAAEGADLALRGEDGVAWTGVVGWGRVCRETGSEAERLLSVSATAMMAAITKRATAPMSGVFLRLEGEDGGTMRAVGMVAGLSARLSAKLSAGLSARLSARLFARLFAGLTGGRALAALEWWLNGAGPGAWPGSVWSSCCRREETPSFEGAMCSRGSVAVVVAGAE